MGKILPRTGMSWQTDLLPKPIASLHPNPRHWRLLPKPHGLRQLNPLPPFPPPLANALRAGMSTGNCATFPRELPSPSLPPSSRRRCPKLIHIPRRPSLNRPSQGHSQTGQPPTGTPYCKRIMCCSRKTEPTTQHRSCFRCSAQICSICWPMLWVPQNPQHQRKGPMCQTGFTWKGFSSSCGNTWRVPVPNTRQRRHCRHPSGCKQHSCHQGWTGRRLRPALSSS